MFCLQDDKQEYCIFLEKLADTLKAPRKERMQLLQWAVDTYSERLEHYAKLYPLQWFNFYDFWQHQPQVDSNDAQTKININGENRFG